MFNKNDKQPKTKFGEFVKFVRDHNKDIENKKEEINPKDAIKFYKGKRIVKKCKLIAVISVCLMLGLTCYRAFTLNEYYNETKENNNLIADNIERYSDFALDGVIRSSSRVIHSQIRIDARDLEKALINEHGVDKLKSFLYDGKFYPEIYDTLEDMVDKHFSTDHQNNKLIIIGTDEGVILIEAGDHLEKFDSVKQKKSIVPWEDFYNAMNNPKVTKEAFEELKKNGGNSNDPIILRMDGNYVNNRPYTVCDLVKTYKNDGVRAFSGYGVLSMASITEDGDIFGNNDSIYMQKNEQVRKIYIYCLDSIDHSTSMGVRRLSEINTMAAGDIEKAIKDTQENILTTIVVLIANIAVLISALFAYKSLSDLQDEIGIFELKYNLKTDNVIKENKVDEDNDSDKKKS